MWSFCSAKASLIFSTKNFSVFGYKVIKHLTSWLLNELVKLTMLWTTGPRSVLFVSPSFSDTMLPLRTSRGWTFTVFIWGVSILRIFKNVQLSIFLMTNSIKQLFRKCEDGEQKLQLNWGRYEALFIHIFMFGLMAGNYVLSTTYRKSIIFFCGL